MTNEEARSMLEAKLKCMIRDLSGTDLECIRRECDGCSLNYEQGNMGEQKECLRMAIAALKAEPCEDAVKRQAVLNTLDTMDKALDENRTVESYKELLKECYKELPPVTPASTECEDAVSREAMLAGLASIAKAKAKSDVQKALMGRVMFFAEHLPPVTPKSLDSVLDKIRAEIEKLPSELTYDGRRMIRRVRVYDIIDKYRAESEDKE